MIEITSLNEDLKDHTKRVEDLRGYLLRRTKKYTSSTVNRKVK